MRETCEKTKFTPSNLMNATNPIVTAQRLDVAKLPTCISNIRTSDHQQIFRLVFIMCGPVLYANLSKILF